MLLLFVSMPSLAADVMARAEAAKKAAAKRGPIPVPEEPKPDEQCFVPAHLEGAQCAEGFKLCVEGFAHGMCDGYGSSTSNITVAYDGEPEVTDGVLGEPTGMPFLHEAGDSVEVGVSMACSINTFGVGVVGRVGETPEERAAAVAKAEAEAAEWARKEYEKCAARETRRINKERRWQRCQLLSVDACRREAFLSCKGNTGERGLVRASWSRPQDKPANATMKLQVLAK